MGASWPLRPLQLRSIAALSVATIALLLLAPFAEVDPARGVTFSNAPFSDEAWNLVGARSFVLFGRPPADEWQTWLLAVPFTVVQALAFMAFGVDLVVARLVVIGAVAAGGALITFGIAPLVGVRNAWLAGLAGVTAGLVLYYGRLAFLEPMVGVFLAAGVLTLVPAQTGASARWGLVAGVSLALAVMTKGHALAAVGGILVVGAVAARPLPALRRWVAGVVTAGLAMAVAWAGFLLWPRRDDVLMVVRDIYPPYQWPTDAAAVVRNVMTYPFGDDTFVLAWPVLSLAGLAAVRLIARLFRGEAAPRDIVVASALGGLIAGLALLSLPDYNANRYPVALVPLAAIAAGWALPSGRLGRTWRRSAIAAAVLLIAGPGVIQHVGWLRDGGSEVAVIQEVAAAHLKPGAVVVGQYAPLVALEEPVSAIVPFGDTVNEADWYAAGARHFVYPSDPSRAPPAPDAVWEQRRELGCIQWGRHAVRICLIEVPDSAPAPPVP